MAVAARPSAAGSPSSLKAALVAFVVLTVASLGFAIYLYTGQEELAQKAEAADRGAASARTQLQDTQATLENLAYKFLGKRTNDPAEIEADLEATRVAVFGRDPARIPDEQKSAFQAASLQAEDPLRTTLQNLHKDWEAKGQELAGLQAEFQRVNGELEARTADLKQTQDQFTAEAERIREDLAQLEQQLSEHRAAWDEGLDRLSRQAQAEGERASEQLSTERRQRQELEQQLAQNKGRVNELVTTLATFRPSADTTSLLQITDGYVVQTVPDQGIVYISLGSRDRIKPGMTFAVYSRIRGIPADGKGKATIIVNNVFDTTSECSVTTSKVGEPIVNQDVIANPVYDRNRKYNFVVAGDFDLDFDGNVDDPAGQQVRKMIEDWGGSLQSGVDTRTDFVVLGAEPALPFPGVQGASEGSKAAQARQAFETAKQEARSLGIPVLTRSQFLHFVGFGVPQNAKDDQRPI